jgi:hypothetical protein
MTFLTKSDDNGKICEFPIKEDRYCVEKEQIMEKLQVRTMDKKKKCQFCDAIMK